MFFDTHEVIAEGSVFGDQVQSVTLYCRKHDKFEWFIIHVFEIGYDKIVRLRCPYCRRLGYVITKRLY